MIKWWLSDDHHYEKPSPPVSLLYNCTVARVTALHLPLHLVNHFFTKESIIHIFWYRGWCRSSSWTCSPPPEWGAGLPQTGQQGCIPIPDKTLGHKQTPAPWLFPDTDCDIGTWRLPSCFPLLLLLHWGGEGSRFLRPHSSTWSWWWEEEDTVVVIVVVAVVVNIVIVIVVLITIIKCKLICAISLCIAQSVFDSRKV